MNFNGTVTGCTSAAVITCDVTTDCASFGGIVGHNSSDCTVSGCTATGVVVPDVNKAGAVIGTNKGTVSGNKYHSSMVGNYAFNIGSGTGDIDGATLNNKTLVLYTERDNSALLAAYAATYNSDSSTAHGGSHPTVSSLNVTLKGYTLHKDGTWNTIALPFDFTAYTGSPLSGATIKQLDTENTTYDSESGVLQVAFKTVTVNTSTGMDRTKPYIVRWSSGADVTDPTFTNVDGRRLANSIGSTTAGAAASPSPSPRACCSMPTTPATWAATPPSSSPPPKHPTARPSAAGSPMSSAPLSPPSSPSVPTARSACMPS